MNHTELLTLFVEIVSRANKLIRGDLQNDPPHAQAVFQAIQHETLNALRRAEVGLPVITGEESVNVQTLASSHHDLQIINCEPDSTGDELPERYIVLNPLEDLRLHASGCPDVGVSMALVDLQRGPVCACIGIPTKDVTITAAMDDNCLLNGSPVYLDPVTIPQEVNVGLHCNNPNNTDSDYQNVFIPLITDPAGLTRISMPMYGVYEMLIKITGNYITMATPTCYLAAIALIVRQAGGVAEQLDGTPLCWNRRTSVPALFSANSDLADALRHYLP